jgi:NitT/TauT family transport system permease protein
MPQTFLWGGPGERRWGWADVITLLTIASLLYLGARLAYSAPAVIKGPSISLSPSVLPAYAGLSLVRMSLAYGLSMLFTVAYGYLAASSRGRERVLIPLLDILQSVPILSFLPVVLLGLSAVLPQGFAAELSSIVLIFTSQVWNLTFSWYQSQKTIPGELREAAAIFRFDWWLRFKTLDLPFAAIGLIWNSIMSWAGGWFFLMAAEIFTVGKRDFRLPGLGAYLSEAANRGDLRAVFLGIAALLAVIILLDQFVWRPLLAWSDRFRLETVGAAEPPSSWVYEAWRASRVIAAGFRFAVSRAVRPFDRMLARISREPQSPTVDKWSAHWTTAVLAAPVVAVLLYGTYRAVEMLVQVRAAQWSQIGLGLGATGLRVAAAIGVALLWTVPAGFAIGTYPRVAAWFQPLAQIAASVPATALFPVLLLALAGLPGGLNITAILLMLMGTQWYLLFNVIAGASAIPQDLKHTATMLGLPRRSRWRTLVLPALFPYVITGLVTAGGGAWNASIIAEYTEFGGRTHSVTGIGSAIAQATAAGDYALLLAATLSMVVAVVAINRFVWRPLYRLAEERYRME